jgi:hypothetical protein
MPDLFGLDIAGLIGDALGGQLLPATITRKTKGARDPAKPNAGLVPGPDLVRTAEGFWEDFTGTPPPTVQLELNDRKAVLIGASIPADVLPIVKDDAITIEGQTLYVVKLLNRDPAAAVYTFLCRDRGTKQP